MILLGCLLAFSIAVAPRAVLVLAWIFSEYWDLVWKGDWVVPLLGILFLPYTTIMYMLVWTPMMGGGAGIDGWDWMWILLGLVLDLSKWAGLWGNRRTAAQQAQRYYPAGAPSSGSGRVQASVSTGQVSPSISSTTVDSGTEPMSPAILPDMPGDDKPNG